MNEINVKGKIEDYVDSIITKDNIVILSQIAALRAVKHMFQYAYGEVNFVLDTYRKLKKDIFCHKELDNYSSAYDLVQEASLFLSKYIGKKLHDKCKIILNSVEKTVPIFFACTKYVAMCLRKEMKHSVVQNDEVLKFKVVDFEGDKEPEDLTKAKAIFRNVVKTDLESKILNKIYDGMEIKDIATMLCISIDKIYKRRRKFKDRYAECYC